MAYDELTAQLVRENRELRDALQAAATSLETVATLSGRATYGNPPVDTCMETFTQVRGYAHSRAKVARDALAPHGVAVTGHQTFGEQVLFPESKPK